MHSNNNCIFPNQTNLLSLIMFQIFAFIILCHFGFFISETSAAQKFYPNGRYGRRSVLPPLMSSSENTDDAINFIGNVANKQSKPNVFNRDQPITLLCYYTGYSNLLKCNPRETSSDVLERTNNESQQ